MTLPKPVTVPEATSLALLAVAAALLVVLDEPPPPQAARPAKVAAMTSQRKVGEVIVLFL